MEDLKKRIERLENLVEDLIIMLGKANQRVVNLSLQTSFLEKQLNSKLDSTQIRKNVS
ncbi:hypothetical protein ACQKP0_21440 [Heyndrickxia sp. NPDC080065]|uniref:hypothetical protein n=1 Tax=Heyndrickxia sp. NPDC080065 TaxID=3390568 RepID=UPI003CFFB7FF